MAEDTEKQLKKRFAEIAERADKYGSWEATDFLGMAEIAVLASMRFPLPYVLCGGYENAERCIAAFGSEEYFGYPFVPDIACLEIRPSSMKFAEQLGHRDFLGSVLALGLERKVIGDIAIIDNTAYLFCTNSIADYIDSSLSSVKHTPVQTKLVAPPEILNRKPEPSTVVIASERIDAIVAAVYKLSRGAGKELVDAGRVFINGKLVQNGGTQIEDGAVISVRGKGRFIYEGVLRRTRSDRLTVSVRIY